MSPRNASTEIGQRRTYTFKGRKFPSVTTILKAYPMEWAIAYGAKHVALRAMSEEFINRYGDPEVTDEDLTKWLKKAPFERRDAAAGAGTDLHAYLEQRLLGKPRWHETVRTPAEQAIENFLDMYRPDPLYVESQVFSMSDGWAGTCDAFVRIYGQTYALDLKTSPHATVDHKARLQLAAYRHGDFIGEDDREIAPVPYTDGAMILAIDRDTGEMHPCVVEAGQNEYRIFLSIARTWAYYTANDGTSVGEDLLMQAYEEAV